MDLSTLDMDAPVFTQREAAQICTIENATIDNWIRHGHLSIRREGDRRLFSGWDLVAIDLIAFLATKFGLKPSDGSKLTDRIIAGYRQAAQSDILDMNNERSIGGPYWGYRQPATYDFTRDGDGLREIRDGDAEIDRVGIVVPTQLVARRTFAAIRALDRL